MERTSGAGGSRARNLVAAAIVSCAAIALGACTPTPTPAPTYSEGTCPDGSGVTVVVDFSEDLSDEIVVRCALGAQQSGIDALEAIGLSVNENEPDAFPGSVCTLDGLPTQGYPYCWSEGGFWGYWAADDQGSEWGFSPIGAGQGPLTEGGVIGFTWAQDFVSDGPRVTPGGDPLPAG